MTKNTKNIIKTIIAITFIVIGTTVFITINQAKSYISCGCGCCGFPEDIEKMAKESCLYKPKGESIQEKINEDNQLTAKACQLQGCSAPIKYVYCN